jgi:uncharacterized protein
MPAPERKFDLEQKRIALHEVLDPALQQFALSAKCAIPRRSGRSAAYKTNKTRKRSMNNAAQEIPASPNEAVAPPRSGIWKKLLGNPFVRIVLGSALLIALHPVAGLALKLVSSTVPAVADWLRSAPRLAGSKMSLPGFYITTTLVVLLSIPLYRIFVRWTERRPIAELSGDGAAAEIGVGVLIGFGLFSAVAGVLWSLGYYHVTSTNPASVMLPVALASASAAVFEELMFRGLVFRIIEQSHGSWIALVVSALFFGLVHLANPNSSLQAALAIAVEAGILLGAAYMTTRRLWLVIGLHFAWNFAESGIYGMPMSGFSMPGLLQGEVHGPELLTGGTFGAENSILAIVFCVAVALCFLYAAKRRAHIVKPRWRRSA